MKHAPTNQPQQPKPKQKNQAQYYGSPFTTGYAPFAAKLARETKMPVLAIDYWLAPIGNFSLILGQVGAAVAYLAKPESVPGVPPSAPPPTSIFIAGDSSGGGSALSALVAQASPGGLPNAGAARLAGGVLYSPWINLLCDTPSYATQAYSKHQPEGLVMGDFEFLKGSINKAVTEFQGNAADYYSGDPKTAKLNDPIANPLFAPPDVLARLPPVSIHTGLPEALAAEQAIFAGRAAAAGALVENHIYDAMWHVFVMYSNGCNAGYGRVIFADNAVAATARFFDRVAAGAGAPQQAPRVPCSVVHYEYNGVDTAAGVTCL
jgi:acetyl esterase/lipase